MTQVSQISSLEIQKEPLYVPPPPSGGVSGTPYYVAMFNPLGNNVVDAPIHVGQSVEPLAVNQGTDGVSIGYSTNVDVNSSSVYTIGKDINVTKGIGTYVIGHTVSIDEVADPYGTGGNIFSLGSYFSIVGGANVDAIVSLGFNNTINATSQTRGVYMFGDSHIINDFVTYSTLIGESCNFTRVDHTTTVGIFNSMTDVTYVYNLGEGNNYDTVTNVVSLGNYNTISGSYNLSVFGSNNNLSGENDKLFIGNNNQNIVVDTLSGNVGIGALPSTFEKVFVQTATDNYGYVHTDGTIKLATFIGLGGGVPSGQIGMESPHPLYIYGYRGGVYDTFIKYDESSTNKYWGLNTYSPSASWHITGQSATSFDYALKVDNLAGQPIIHGRNNQDVSIGQTTPFARLDVRAGTSGDIFRLNNSNFFFANKLLVNNDGSFYSGSINAFGGFGTGNFQTDHLNYDIKTSFSSWMAVTNAGLVGNRSSYGVIGSSIGSADWDYRLTVRNDDNGAIGSVMKVITTSSVNVNDGFDYSSYGVNIIHSGVQSNTGAGTWTKYGLNIEVTNGDVNYAVRFGAGKVGAPSLQIGNAGLSSGDLYVDTVLNIEANGDLFVARKV